MAHQKVPRDLSTDKAAEQPTGRMPTRSSAQLAEKLKQMETPKQDSDLMECDPEELKKRTRATTPHEGTHAAKQNPISDAHPPDIKRS